MPNTLRTLPANTTFRTLMVLSLLLISLPPLSAQPYCTVKTFNLRDGLASNNITGITQTSDQLIWISTWNGLNCYDGYRFMNFQDYTDSRRTLATNRILNIHPSSKGNIWCVSYDMNTYLFDRKQCEYVDINKIIKERFKLDFHAVRALPMSNGTTWLLNYKEGGAFFRVKDDAYEEKDGITMFGRNILSQKGESLSWIIEDGKKRQWITTNKKTISADGKYKSNKPYQYLQQVGKQLFFASADGHIALFSEMSGKFNELRMPSGINSINILSQTGGHLLMASTNRGLLVYDISTGKSHMIELVPPFAAAGQLKSIYVDSKDRVWAATVNDDILLINAAKGTLTDITPKETSPLRQTKTTFIYEDKLNQTVWIATEKGFSGYYDEAERQLKSYPIRKSELQSIIYLPLFDAQGNMWYIGEHGLVLVNFRYNYLRHTTGFDEVRSLMYDNKGRLWAGNSAGFITVYSPDGNREGYIGPDGKLHSEPVMFSTRIYSLYQDSHKRVWIGTKGDGLYCIEANGQTSHYLHSNADKFSLPSNQVYDICEDRHNRIWIATFEKGICLISGKRIIHNGNLLKGYPVQDFNKARRLTKTKTA